MVGVALHRLDVLVLLPRWAHKNLDQVVDLLRCHAEGALPHPHFGAGRSWKARVLAVPTSASWGASWCTVGSNTRIRFLRLQLSWRGRDQRSRPFPQHLWLGRTRVQTYNVHACRLHISCPG